MITLMVAFATFAVLIAMERLWPHSPAPLVAVAGGIAAAWFLGLEKMGVSIVGLIPRGFPSLTVPDPALAVPLLPGALGIALDEFYRVHRRRARLRAPAKILRSTRTGSCSPPVRRTLAAPCSASCRRAAALRRPRSCAPLAASRSWPRWSPRAPRLATMLFLAPVLGLMPHATLAAVVIVYSVGLIKPSEFRAIRSVRTMEFRWALVACVGVLVFGTLKGIVVAIIVSMIGLASQSAHPRVYVIGRKRAEDVLRPLSPEHRDDETFEGLLILRPEGRLFFVNAEGVGRPDQGPGRAVPAARVGARHEPRIRHRVLGPADAERRRAAR